MNRRGTALMFSRASDEWRTPPALFAELDAEFTFDCDVAASPANTTCVEYFSLEHDALGRPWRGCCFCNPPYSQCRAFIAKAAAEAHRGVTVVCLVPARTDTRWWHAHVWDARRHALRPGVEVRFLPGRLKFGDSRNSAPFPSVVIVFRGVDHRELSGADAHEVMA